MIIQGSQVRDYFVITERVVSRQTGVLAMGLHAYHSDYRCTKVFVWNGVKLY